MQDSHSRVVAVTVVELLQSEDQDDALPLVTVAMPVYNAGKYLRLSVLSIIRQTFTNWELLIINDGSTDNAFQTIADIDDVRIRVLDDGKNKGLAERLNECIELARGKYFARMDADDVSYPDRLAQQLNTLNNNSKLDLVAVRAITINENNTATSLFPYALMHDEICATPWKGFYLPHPTWLGKTEWFRKYHYTIPAPYFCEDQELILRSYRDSLFATVNEVLFAYRCRDEVNEKKLLRTRWTVLNIQLRAFIRLNLWHFAVLSIATFFMKIVNDLLKKSGINDFQQKHRVIDDTAVSKWNKILNALKEK